jgi:hypothetical protein
MESSRQHIRPMQFVFPFLLVVTLIWAPVWHVYWSNLDNLHLPLSYFWQPILLSSTLVYGAGIGAIALSKMIGKAKAGPLLLLFIGLVACLFVNFLVADYGFLQGAEPAWAENDFHGYLELSVVLGLVLVFRIYHQEIYSNLNFFTWVVLLVSVAFFPTVIKDKSGKAYALADRGMFELSVDRNVFLFILDTVQADVVNEVFARNSQLREQYEGFTLYRNVTSAFPKTYASVPSILTGQVFDNSDPLHEFMATAFEQSLPRLLNDAGFDVRLWGFAPQVFTLDVLLADNVIVTGEASDLSAGSQDLSLLINLSLLRLSPHFLRPSVYNHGDFVWRHEAKVSENCQLENAARQFSSTRRSFDANFFDEFIQCSSVNREESVFRVFHLYGSHAPLKFGKKYEFIDTQPLKREAFVDQTEGVLFALGQVLERLDALGALSEATIVVTSDHGAGEFSTPINVDQVGLPLRSKKNLNRVPDKIIEGGVPLFMVKPSNETQLFTVSDKPVELPDVPATVMGLLGMNHQFAGQSVIQEIDDTRVRFHKHYDFSGWDMDFIVPLKEYQVDGFSWYPESWRESGRDFNQKAISNFAGLLVLFSENDQRLKGWRSRRGLISIDGKSAEVHANQLMTGPQLLEVTHGVYRAKDASTISASLGAVQRRWQFYPGDAQRTKAMVLPASAVAEMESQPLRFSAETAAAANLSFIELSVAAVEPNCETSSILHFAEGAVGDKLTTYGWQPAKGLKTRSLDHSSGILCAFYGKVTGDLVVTFDIVPTVFPSHLTQRFQLTINDEVQKVFTISTAAEISVSVPESSYLDKQYLEFVFRYETPIRPSDIKSSWSGQKSAISIISMRIDPSSG